MTSTSVERATDTRMLDAVRDIVGSAGTRVFGEPIVQGDVVVLPAAKVRGGMGGGSGEGPDKQGREGSGRGSGFGVTAKALGVFVIRDGKVEWRPAVDVNRIVLGGQLVGVVALLALRAILKRRRR